jgi:RNA polymerase sigma factor (TIGR02999 family)
MATTQESVTNLLIQWRDGDQTALERLVPLVYNEMRRLAHHYMRNERTLHTLQTSALVNEAYLRLVDHNNMCWQNRAHFLAVAAQAMRRVLVDYARSRRSNKRGGEARRVDSDAAELVAVERAAELVALDDALNELSSVDPRKCRIVELRYFGGCSVEETAKILDVAPSTINREWSAAKAWLLRSLSVNSAGEPQNDHSH